MLSLESGVFFFCFKGDIWFVVLINCCKNRIRMHLQTIEISDLEKEIIDEAKEVFSKKGSHKHIKQRLIKNVDRAVGTRLSYLVR